MSSLIEEHIWAQWVILGPLGAFLLAAAVIDVRTGRIPNRLTYSSILVGLVCHALIFGLGGLASGLMAVVFSFAVGLFLSPVDWLGGGDVKLLMGVGAFLGLGGLGETFFYAVLAGAVLGLLSALYTGYLKDMLVRLFRFLRGVVRMFLYRTSLVREELETDPRSRIPFALPILAGGMLAYLEAATGWPGLIGWFVEPFMR